MKRTTKFTVIAASLIAALAQPVEAGITKKQIATYVTGAVALGAAGYYIWSNYFAPDTRDTQSDAEREKRTQAVEKRTQKPKQQLEHVNLTRSKGPSKKKPTQTDNTELIQQLDPVEVSK